MQVTQIGPIVSGAAPVHYVVGDQNGNILSPAVGAPPGSVAITPSWDAPLDALIVTPDATGWFFSAPSNAVAASGNVTFNGNGAGFAGGTVHTSFPASILAPAVLVTGFTLFQQ